MAATDEGIIYEGASARAKLGKTQHASDTVVWIASMTKAHHGRRRDAARERGNCTLMPSH